MGSFKKIYNNIYSKFIDFLMISYQVVKLQYTNIILKLKNWRKIGVMVFADLHLIDCSNSTSNSVV